MSSVSPAPSTSLRPLLLGHRGACRHAPENTIAAFDLALAHGCHGFEFDVRLTADGHAIVCHDPELAGLPVAQSKYRDLVAACRVRAQGVAANEFSPPTLPGVLLRYASTAFLDIELKVSGLEELTLSALRAKPPERGYFVSSFLPEVVTRLHELDQGVPLGLICRTPDQFKRWPTLPVSALFLHGDLLRSEIVDQVHAAAKQVFAWTINDEQRMGDIAAMGVEGIISDQTRPLGRAFAASQSS